MKSIISLFLGFLLSFSTAEAQIQQPKVAVVLSGGGAKGLAHLGVLKALEENQIPIDYIIGTSMGGIIGGFYAAGYSIEEMEKIVLSQDFQDWAAGRLNDKYKYFLYKEKENASILSLKIALDTLLNFSLKSTIVSDKVINFALAELLAKASAKANCDFDSLMIPFRCLAADIFTQEEVILKSGNLNDAIRATLNVPFFFQPVKVQNKYLFDGGVYNNFPVDIAKKEFKPDVIIGVNVSSKTYNEYPYQQDEKLIENSLLYLILSKSDSSQIDSTGIYIQPALEGYSALNFEPVSDYLRLGYEAALAKMPQISRKIAREVKREEIALKRAKFNNNLPDFRINKVNILGLRPGTQRYVRHMFRFRPQDLTLENVKKKYFRLAEADKFELLYPNFVFHEEAKAYNLDLRLKPDRSIKADLGGNLASRNISQLFLGFKYDYVSNLLYSFKGNFYTGKFYLSTEWSARIHIPTKIPVYFEPVFVYNKWNYTSISEVFFKNSLPQIILNQNDSKAGLDIGIAAGRENKFTFGFFYFNNNDRYSNYDFVSSTDTLDLTKFQGNIVSIGFAQNNLNRKQFASAGKAINLAAQYIRGEEQHSPGSNSLYENESIFSHQWFRLKLNAEQYFDFGRFCLGYMFEGLLSNQPFFKNYISSTIAAPAFYPLSDSKFLFLKNFRSFNYAAMGLRNVFKIRSNFELRGEAYLFNAYKPVFEAEPQIPMAAKEQINLRLAATLALVYHTMLGPASLNFNYYEENKNKIGVFFNIGFLLYNKRSLE